MDRSTVIGFVFGSTIFMIGMKLGGPIMSFVDIPSFMIVGGGATGALMIAFTLDHVKLAWELIKFSFRQAPEFDYLRICNEIIKISETARKEGLLSLDAKVAEMPDPFMARGIQMVVDSIDVNVIENIMMCEIDSRSSRHADGKAVLEFIASVAPAFGMIGTIIGLVQMLRNLNDPTSIGPAMAVALITTFYGAVLANFLMIPMGKKMEMRSSEEALYSELIVRGCLMIAQGFHPRIIQERLLAYLSADVRNKYSELALEDKLEKKG